MRPKARVLRCFLPQRETIRAKWKELIMKKATLQGLNEALIDLLTNLRDQINDAFDDLGIATDDEDSCDDDNGDE